MREYRKENPDRCTVVLSTASPFKFAKSVLEALGRETPEDAFEMLDLLSEISGIPVPASIEALRTAEIIHKDETTIENAFDYVLGKAATLCRA